MYFIYVISVLESYKIISKSLFCLERKVSNIMLSPKFLSKQLKSLLLWEVLSPCIFIRAYKFVS